MIATREITIVDAALCYLSAGISVIPVRAKIAAVNWRIFTVERATVALVEAWQRNGLLTGIAVVCGRVSNNLVVLDLDGDDAVKAFQSRFAQTIYADTWTVRSGSGKGMHIYWRVAQMPRTLRALGTTVGNIELRAEGCYVVAPPSPHATGGSYSVYNRAPIRRLDNCAMVQEWLLAHKTAKQNSWRVTHPANLDIKQASRWAAAALAAECAGVRTAAAGRNNALNRAAFKLGQLVDAGHLDRSIVDQALADAASALTATDGERGTWSTIQSGLAAGARKPRFWRKQK